MYLCFFVNENATTKIYTYWPTLSQHVALPCLDRQVVCGVGDVDADREILAVLELAVAAHILDQHIVAVVLDADRALRITVHRDVADRQPGDARAGVGARGHIVEEARDIIRLDVLDGQVAHVPADADGDRKSTRLN